MAKKTSKASTTSRSAGSREDAAAPENLPGLESPSPSAPTDPTEELVMPARETPLSAAASVQNEAIAPATEESSPSPDRTPVSEMPPAARPPGPTSPGWRFGRNELLAMGGFALLGLISIVWFFRCLYAHPKEDIPPEIPKHFPQPLKGQLLTLAQADTGWRDRVEADRVRAEEVILPRLHVKLDPSGASKGFLRIEFLDTEGKIRGDIPTVAIEGGRFKDSGRGEQVSADGTEVTVSGTVGFISRSLFAIYRGGEETRWSVRLREGPDYSHGPWSIFGQAQVSDQKP